MRVITGTARGKRLLAPEGVERTRPTTDRVKEAVFGALQFAVAGSRVLDAFAGSGALGIEALSRGAREAVLVEKDRTVAPILRQNLKNTALTERARVIEGDFFDVAAQLGGRFDLIFLDPPYRAGLYEEAIACILRHGLLAPGGRVIAEHDGSAPLGDLLVEVKRKKYGKSTVSFLAQEEDA